MVNKIWIEICFHAGYEDVLHGPCASWRRCACSYLAKHAYLQGLIDDRVLPECSECLYEPRFKI